MEVGGSSTSKGSSGDFSKATGGAKIPSIESPKASLPSRRGLRLGSVLVALAMLPPLLGAFYNFVGPTPQPLSAAVGRPALAFDQYSVNLGPVSPRRYASARYRFVNTSDRPVEISALVPSCGCLNPRLEKKTYAPGEKGEFRLRVETPNEEPGPKDYTCKVRYNDGSERETEVRFRLVLPEKQVVVRPRGLAFYQLGSSSTSQSISITDYRQKPLKILRATSTSPLVRVEVKPSEKDLEDVLSMKLEATVRGNIPAGRVQALIQVETDDSTFPMLTVPVILIGPKSRPAKESSVIPAGHSTPLPRKSSSLPPMSSRPVGK